MKQVLGLDNLAISHNHYSPKQYLKRRGLTFDILISSKSKTNRKIPIHLPQTEIEVRNWDTDRWVNKKQFEKRFLNPFVDPTDQHVIVDVGEHPIYFTQNQKNQLLSHRVQYHHINNTKQLLKFVTQKLIETASKTVTTTNKTTKILTRNKKFSTYLTIFEPLFTIIEKFRSYFNYG